MGVLEFATWLQATPVSLAIQSTEWTVPALQSLHILMIGVVFIAVLMIALRVLGWSRVDEPFAKVWRRFAPFMWGGVVVMAVTGLLLTLSEPVRELMTLSFRLKMLLLAVGLVSAAAFGRTMSKAARMPAGVHSNAFPAGTRVAAAATVLLWLAVIFLGRAIAYDDAIWGAWSPAVLQATP
ncbi:MAG: hypothetical protein M3Y79_05145 [Pseudomonadota bacterium]|nr:hypothetical protein [Pseudomonadota bacterium]